MFQSTPSLTEVSAERLYYSLGDVFPLQNNQEDAHRDHRDEHPFVLRKPFARLFFHTD